MKYDTSLFIYSTAPSKEIAEKLAEALISQHLVAGLNILAGMQSIYHWQGEIMRHEECSMFMHSTQSKWAEIQATVKALHPYVTPCLIALPVTSGLPDFMEWIHITTNTLPHISENL